MKAKEATVGQGRKRSKRSIRRGGTARKEDE